MGFLELRLKSADLPSQGDSLRQKIKILRTSTHFYRLQGWHKNQIQEKSDPRKKLNDDGFYNVISVAVTTLFDIEHGKNNLTDLTSKKIINSLF